MNKNILILLTLVAVIIVGGYLYFMRFSKEATDAGQSVESQVSSTTAKEIEAREEEPPQRALFDLKSSIQGAVEDSVQEDIQQAVEKKINNTDKNQ